MKNIAVLLLLLAVALITAGCSPKSTLGTVKITGEVLLDDEPVSGIIVNFKPRGGEKNSGVGRTDGKGNYTLTTAHEPVGSGVVPGEYDVTFKKVVYEDESGKLLPKPLYVVPQKYESPKTSGIEPVKVEAGKNQPFKFELKTTGN